MTDYTELKRLAEHHLSLGHAYTVATPSAVLALIAENERLAAILARKKSRRADDDECLSLSTQSIDELRKDAERYRFLANRTFFVDGLFRTPSPDPVDGSNPLKGSVSQHFEDAIDASMGKGEDS